MTGVMRLSIFLSMSTLLFQMITTLSHAEHASLNTENIPALPSLSRHQAQHDDVDVNSLGTTEVFDKAAVCVIATDNHPYTNTCGLLQYLSQGNYFNIHQKLAMASLETETHLNLTMFKLGNDLQAVALPVDRGRGSTSSHQVPPDRCIEAVIVLIKVTVIDAFID